MVELPCLKAKDTLVATTKLREARAKFLNDGRADTGFVEAGCYIDSLHTPNTAQATSVCSGSIIEHLPDIINTQSVPSVMATDRCFLPGALGSRTAASGGPVIEIGTNPMQSFARTSLRKSDSPL